MTIPDEVLDAAYAIYEEWGPDRRIDRIIRLTSKFPALSPEEIDWLIQRLKEISKVVWKIAEQGGEAKLGRGKVIELLREQFPFLQSKGLNKAIFLVNYYAYHEGYDRTTILNAETLGPEIGPESCRTFGCSRLRIEHSIYCCQHHIESLLRIGELPGWSQTDQI